MCMASRFILALKFSCNIFISSKVSIFSGQILTGVFERQSVMWCEEGVVISGLLMGLNAIDYNVHMKGEEFNRSVSYMWPHPLYGHTHYMEALFIKPYVFRFFLWT